jgi:mono/diheme cytochrome c family protein
MGRLVALVSRQAPSSVAECGDLISRASGAAVALLAIVAAAASCSPTTTREGVDPSTLPSDVRADYEVFAQRCSKCHSLARPLDSGITDDEFWKLYVERMRRMPSSGISTADTAPILRFLHHWSAARIAKREGR